VEATYAHEVVEMSQFFEPFTIQHRITGSLWRVTGTMAGTWFLRGIDRKNCIFSLSKRKKTVICPQFFYRVVKHISLYDLGVVK
jgi:hypothetical protein